MMEITIEGGMVHGQPTFSFKHNIDEHTLLEEGWEKCEEIKNAAMTRAATLMDPERATWVTVEWTWRPI